MPSINELISKYWKLIQAKRLIIGIIIIVSTIIWFGIYKMIIVKRQTYSTTAIIKFDDPESRRDVRAVTDFAIEGSSGKLAVLTTSTFLKMVVDSLNLNLVVVTPNIDRFTLFKEINISQDAKFGLYTFEHKDNSVIVSYTNEEDEIYQETIVDIPLPLNRDLNFNYKGLKMQLAAEIINREEIIEIAHLNTRGVIEGLKENLSSSIDRAGIILEISYTSKDPELTAVITNTISHMYIEKLLEMKRYRTTGVLHSFEEQLAVAREELDKSEKELRQFREANPYLNLTNVGQTLVTSLAADQSNLQETLQSINRLKSLMTQRKSGDFNQQSLVYLELLSFLEPRLATGSQVFTQEYQNLLTQRNQRIAENYAPGHPIIKSLEDRINEIKANIDDKASAYLTRLETNRLSLQEMCHKIGAKYAECPAVSFVWQNYSEIARLRPISILIF